MAAAQAAPPLTVVIVNWNTADLSIRSARAILDDGVPATSVVVVDNGSARDDYERLTGELRDCHVIRLDENVGFAGGANAGAAARPAGAYLVVNNDAFVHRPGTVDRLLGALDDGTVGIAAPRILNPDLTLQPSVVPTNGPLPALVRASGLSRFLPNDWQPRLSTHWDHAASREIEAANGAVLLVRGATWDALGGFDEQIYMYAEDLDLCWRARELGWTVRFVADAEFVHLGNASGRKQWSNPERARLVASSEAAMIRRRLPPASARATVAITAAGVFGRWLLRRLTGDRAAAETYWATLRGYLAGPPGERARPRA